MDSSGNVYIADSSNQRIRKVNAAGIISTFVGGAVNDGGLAPLGHLNSPGGVARDNAGNTYIADSGNNRVRKVASNGIITTVAGTGVAGYSGDGGAATSAQLNYPIGLALDAAGNLYIADFGNYLIRKVNTSGVISTVASQGHPYAVALDGAGNLYSADPENECIWKMNTSGGISNLAGKMSSITAIPAMAVPRPALSSTIPGAWPRTPPVTFTSQTPITTASGKSTHRESSRWSRETAIIMPPPVMAVPRPAPG